MHLTYLELLAVATTALTAGMTNSMGFIGCSMGEDIAAGYVAVGGQRMWGPYGLSGLAVQSWTNPGSEAWQRFDQQAARYGKPSAVWVQICIFADPGATYDEVKQLIANARQHAAPEADIYITGQPIYANEHTCYMSGPNGPKLTDSLARQAGADVSQNTSYAGLFSLYSQQVADGCHANVAGQLSLGQQALGFWG